MVVGADVESRLIVAGDDNRAVVVDGAFDSAGAVDRGAGMDVDPAKRGNGAVVDGERGVRSEPNFVATGQIGPGSENEKLGGMIPSVASDFETQEFQVGIGAGGVGFSARVFDVRSP